MGHYSDYLSNKLGSNEINAERKAQLKKISELRGGRDVLVFAADLQKGNAQIQVGYQDLLPVQDLLSDLHGNALDLILETPGGSGPVAEDIMNAIRAKYSDVGVIVPGYAKSAGTIMAMAADEILMGTISALGPIDAQVSWQGKWFSAGELLEGMDRISTETKKAGHLDLAYIPILQHISPGELEHARHALDFAKELVAEWLETYKFRTWNVHTSTGSPAKLEEKKHRAQVIAKELCNHKKWHTHDRSIRLSDLGAMGLKVTDYSLVPDLADAINRYYTLLQMTFQRSAVYKIYETVSAQVYKMLADGQPRPARGQTESAIIEVKCINCKSDTKLQLNLGTAKPLQAGCLPFPPDGQFRCPGCGAVQDLSVLRKRIEKDSGLPAVKD
jgi:hypothetical protein